MIKENLFKNKEFANYLHSKIEDIKYDYKTHTLHFKSDSFNPLENITIFQLAFDLKEFIINMDYLVSSGFDSKSRNASEFFCKIKISNSESKRFQEDTELEAIIKAWFYVLRAEELIQND